MTKKDSNNVSSSASATNSSKNQPQSGAAAASGGGGGSGSVVSNKEEKRLKPIFDLVDEGNYKRAITQLDKFLKKTATAGESNVATSANGTKARAGTGGGGGQQMLQSVAAIHQAKALKCLCLWRIPGRQNEATEQANLLLAEEPDDEGSLGVFSLCLRDMNKNAEIEQLYSKAVDKNPKNEDLLSCLIMSYVRTDNFKLQQLRSLQLNKLSSKTAAQPSHPTSKPYYFWAVMALLLQARKDKINGSKLHLPLARKMMQKSFEDSTATSQVFAGDESNSSSIGRVKLEQVELMLMILEEEEDYLSAFQLFTKYVTVFEKELPVLRDRQRVQYLLQIQKQQQQSTTAENTSAVATNGSTAKGDNDSKSGVINDVAARIDSICRDVILHTNSSTDWFFFKTIIDNNIIGSREKPSLVVSCSDEQSQPRSKTKQLIEFLTEERNKNSISIAHHYAVMYLRKQINNNLNSSYNTIPDHGSVNEAADGVDPYASILPDMSSLMITFYQSFGHKSPFFSYARPCLTVSVCESLLKHFSYFDLIGTDDPSKMFSSLSLESKEENKQKDEMYRLLSLCEVDRFLTRSKLSLDSSSQQMYLEKSEILRKLYYKYLPLGESLQSTEPQFSSKFIILSVHYLVDAYVVSCSSNNSVTEASDQSYLWIAIGYLDAALKHSPLDPLLLMLLLRLYSYLGLTITCTDLMDKMQIKQFLLPTTSWVLSNKLSSCGAYQQAQLLNTSIIKYIHNSTHTIPDFVVQAYRNGAFRKIVDMLNWKESLLKSHSFFKCIVDEMFLDQIHIDEHVDFVAKCSEFNEFLDDYDKVMSELGLWEDDRDFDLHYNWEMSGDCNWSGDEMKKASFNLEMSYLKVRYTLICCICLLITHPHHQNQHRLSSENNKNRKQKESTATETTVKDEEMRMFEDKFEKFLNNFERIVNDTSKLFNSLRLPDCPNLNGAHLDEEPSDSGPCGFANMKNHPFSPFTCPINRFFKLNLHKFYLRLLNQIKSRIFSTGSSEKCKDSETREESVCDEIKEVIVNLKQITNFDSGGKKGFIIHTIDRGTNGNEDMNVNINCDDLMDISLICELLSLSALALYASQNILSSSQFTASSSLSSSSLAYPINNSNSAVTLNKTQSKKGKKDCCESETIGNSTVNGFGEDLKNLGFIEIEGCGLGVELGDYDESRKDTDGNEPKRTFCGSDKDKLSLPNIAKLFTILQADISKLITFIGALQHQSSEPGSSETDKEKDSKYCGKSNVALVKSNLTGILEQLNHLCSTKRRFIHSCCPFTTLHNKP